MFICGGRISNIPVDCINCFFTWKIFETSALCKHMPYVAIVTEPEASKSLLEGVGVSKILGRNSSA